MRRYLPVIITGISVLSMLFSGGCDRQSASNPEATSFTLAETRESITVDGALNETVWNSSESLGGFRIDADPARKPSAETTVLTAYSDDALLVAFVCKNEAEADACELLVFSRPETPYYSPYLQRLDYMNAKSGIRTQRQFMVTSSGEKEESNIYKTGPHSPYITDNEWSGNWTAAAKKTGDSYTVEIAVPWDSIGGKPIAGHDFRLHFVRLRNDEVQSFAWIKSENIHAPSHRPEDFNQEHPLAFSPVTFKDDGATLTRFVETESLWNVSRQATFYDDLLTDKPFPNRAAHFYLGIRGFLLPDSIRAKYSDAEWAAEEKKFITEAGSAGMNGPFMPYYFNSAGKAQVDKLHDTYGMRFSWHGHVGDAAAKEAGATIMRPRGATAFFDPAYVTLKAAAIRDFLKAHGKEPWLDAVRGQDEPFNQIATVLQPCLYDTAEKEIREQYGVGLGVPKGIPGRPYQDQAAHDNAFTVPDHKTSLERIALFRWMNKRYYNAMKPEYDTVKRYAPNVLYQAYNRNAVSDLDFLDQSNIHDITDFYSADPYPSFCAYVYGMNRSKYHVGFTSKMVTDLACGKPVQMIIQGCDMIQRYSTPENVREWASQAAKTGAAMIDWWGNPRMDHPDLYREMLRISNLWMKLPALAIPENPEIGVIYSDDSRAAVGDEGLHAHYTLHVIIGETIGAPFRFVSENHVRKGLHSLDGLSLIIAPHLGYVSREFAEALQKKVNDGATLVLLDPDAFRHDIETGSLADIRREFLGLGECPKKNATALVATDAAREYGDITELPLRPIRIAADNLNARSLDVPEDGEVLFTYSDGKPAAFSRKVGDGEVIVFGAMPFEDSELIDTGSGWEAYFKALIEKHGIETGNRIWDFVFPETGGEVETADIK